MTAGGERASSLAPTCQEMFGLMRSLAVMLVVAVALVSDAAPQEKAPRVAAPGPARLEQLVDANIVGVHAYQILLARKQSNVDPVCWSVRDKKAADLEELVAHQASLLSS